MVISPRWVDAMSLGGSDTDESGAEADPKEDSDHNVELTGQNALEVRIESLTMMVRKLDAEVKRLKKA